jgi:hypothetical protein
MVKTIFIPIKDFYISILNKVTLREGARITDRVIHKIPSDTESLRQSQGHKPSLLGEMGSC